MRSQLWLPPCRIDPQNHCIILLIDYTLHHPKAMQGIFCFRERAPVPSYSALFFLPFISFHAIDDDGAICGGDEHSSILLRSSLTVHIVNAAGVGCGNIVTVGDVAEHKLTAEEYISATKDKQRRKRIYREHIRRLFELYALFAPEQEFLRCLSLAPPAGVNARIFSRSMGRTNLNSVNTLVDMGLLQRQECHKILLHPLILEVVLVDLKPSVQNCGALLTQIQFLMLHHGADLEHTS